jgi:hypothetical protein
MEIWTLLRSSLVAPLIQAPDYVKGKSFQLHGSYQCGPKASRARSAIKKIGRSNVNTRISICLRTKIADLEADSHCHSHGK